MAIASRLPVDNLTDHSPTRVPTAIRTDSVCVSDVGRIDRAVVLEFPVEGNEVGIVAVGTRENQAVQWVV